MIYLANIDLGFWNSDIYELVEAETREHAFKKVNTRYPNAKEVIINEPI